MGMKVEQQQQQQVEGDYLPILTPQLPQSTSVPPPILESKRTVTLQHIPVESRTVPSVRLKIIHCMPCAE